MSELSSSSSSSSFKALKLYNNNNNNKLERNKTVSNRVNEDTYLKLKEILCSQNIPLGEWLQDQIEQFILSHGDIKQTCTLDQFKDENYIPTPDFFSSIPVWENYAKKCTDKIFKKWDRQLNDLLGIENREIRNR